jgi:hypothetical protein
VVKIGRLPAIVVVTTGALRDIPAAGKLAGVRVVVATGTLQRQCPEVHVLQRPFEIGRTMAIGASNSTMCAEQWKPGSCVIEAAEFLPLNGRVAGLASGRAAVRPPGCHLLAELP